MGLASLLAGNSSIVCTSRQAFVELGKADVLSTVAVSMATLLSIDTYFKRRGHARPKPA